MCDHVWIFEARTLSTTSPATMRHVRCIPDGTKLPRTGQPDPHCHFRGLFRFHSRYGPPDRSAAQRRPLSRGSDPCGYPHKPLVSYRINRQLSGWNLPPLMIRAFGAHCQIQTHAAQQTTSAYSIT
jgi:hypothetical protein